ncbi:MULTISPECIES: K+/H+ antiporter subunit F [Rubrivivax]|uniref:K+/H+ antiporter subunit F n=1 Tax=Rubrivivax benzoatilyticus TaxID=316997 RepID=A0ABX0HXQ3_9BURK|nr:MULTISPECIES: K+/H+ antiporter subunit F [Rubrivivax]MCD0422311.1 K+/H+ antiporter subunit F [Rubrivivax sp. JA1024]EGJ11446.1 putative monovalent cation/H+ antiporter subunit F [Rubrivivax benzoatilyticus JA2 = ATCC BAA-35]MCC9595228.1 K+/H+ antiporter subunit F [Rubrivivax sp. JA1055]MCC9647979.1 K+/H+ antiporter subunit F [Rubrivivax sp. JA1029]NHK99771.1 K+/H+ antiporter subunit F [Rubrivivax benzoatilyticus]
MTPLLVWAVAATLALYALAMALGLARLMRGPSAQDRVLALDFLYVVGMLMMLVLAIRYDSRMYFEGALLMVLFGFVGSVAMAKFLLRGEAIE